MNKENDEELERSIPDHDEVREHRNERAAKAQFHPLKLFTDNAWAARIWFLFSMALIAVVAIQPFFIINAYRTKERVIIMDASGTYSIAPTLDFSQADKLHEEMALWSTMALFSQNPNGFDMPELLDKMFLAEPLRRARSIFSNTSQEFKEKNIHQKVEIFEIKILQTRGEQIFAQVKGQLIRTGTFEGKAFVEDPQFSLALTLHRNPNMLNNKRFPLAVTSFEESILL